MTKSSHHNHEDLDALIKQALQQEYASVVAPPPEALWEGIRARLEETSSARPARPRQSRRPLPWNRFVLAAAACLMLLVGGITMMRADHAFILSRPQMVRDSGVGSPEGMGGGEILAENGKEALPGDARAANFLQGTGSGEWPPVIGQSYRFLGEKEFAVNFETPTEIALYEESAGEKALLFIRGGYSPGSLESLREAVSREMGAPVTIEHAADMILLRAAEGTLMGAAWNIDSTLLLALVDPAGQSSVEDFEAVYLSITGAR